eukprot:1340205-Pleurochrysis_carterae.AAC.1
MYPCACADASVRACTRMYASDIARSLSDACNACRLQAFKTQNVCGDAGCAYSGADTKNVTRSNSAH